MILDHTKGQRPFTSKEINVVMGVAQQTAIAMDNFRLQEEARRASEAVRFMGDVLSDGVIRLGGDLRIIALDPGAESLLRWTTAEVAGRGLGEAFDATGRDGSRLSDIPQVSERMLRSAASRGPAELSFRRKDGSRVLCAVLTMPMRRDLNGPEEVLCLLRKITPPAEDGPAITSRQSPATDTIA